MYKSGRDVKREGKAQRTQKGGGFLGTTLSTTGTGRIVREIQSSVIPLILIMMIISMKYLAAFKKSLLSKMDKNWGCNYRDREISNNCNKQSHTIKVCFKKL